MLNTSFIPSHNYSTGRHGYTPIAIVIHIMEGTLEGTDSWFQNLDSKVSAHFGIGKNGNIHQYVAQANTAWHAGRVYNPTWKLIKSSGDKGEPYINPNFYTFGIEHEGDEKSDWTDEMYQSSSELIASLAKKWNIPLDRDHVIGHHEIYALKTCPGFVVDLNKLITMASNITNPQLIQEPEQYVPASEKGVIPVTPINALPVYNMYNKIVKSGKATTVSNMHIRSGPALNQPVVAVIPGNVQLAFDGYIDNGMPVNNNARWYYTDEGNWFWSGAVK